MNEKEKVKDNLVTCTFCNFKQVWNGTPICFNCGKSIVSELINTDDKKLFDETIKKIRFIIEVIKEKENYGQLCPNTLEELKKL